MEVYGTTENIDPWVGMIAEDHPSWARIGELNYYVIRDQFLKFRDGDRFWYQIDPELQWEVGWLDRLSLSQIIQYNTGITGLPSNVFYAVPLPSSILLGLTGLILVSLKRRFA